MSVIVMGAGNLGRLLAERLSRQAFDVVVVDRDAAKVRRLHEELDVLAIEGSATDPGVLHRAKVGEAEIFLAVTSDDTANLVACSLAARQGAACRVARVSTLAYFDEELGLPPAAFGIDLAFQPEVECAEEIHRLLTHPQVFEKVEFFHGRGQMVAFKVAGGSPLEGRPLVELPAEARPDAIRIVAIERNGRVMIPRGRDRMRAADRVYVVGRAEVVPEFLRWAGLAAVRLQRVIIVGGGAVGMSLARRLEGSKVDVRAIEKSAETAERISTTLKEAMVFQGDGTDVGLLREVGVREADCFVAVTGEDEANILACVLAKEEGVPKTVTRINKLTLVELASTALRVDAVVSPLLSGLDAVLRFVRRGSVTLARSLKSIPAEMLEMEVLADSPVAGEALSSLRFPKGAIIGSVLRGEELLAATGDQVLRVGDRAVVFLLPEAVSRVEKLFSARH